MAFTTPRTWTSLQVVTAAELNVDVRDNVSHLANPAAVRVHRTSNQSLTTSTQTAILFDAESYDTAGLHSTSSLTTRLTVPAGWAGVYRIFGVIRFAANVTGTRAVNILLNGATIISEIEVAASAAAVTLPVSTDYKLAVADYVELRGFQSSGGNLNVEFTVPVFPHFGMTWQGIG